MPPTRIRNRRRRTPSAASTVAAVATAVALLLGVIAAAPGDADAQADTVTLTLLHNNDGESKLLPNGDSGFPGIARFTQQFQDLGTATDADILLRVTSGDNFLASKEFSAALARDGEPLFDAIALSGLYEAMGLGNHDFDFGPDVAARFIGDFSPAVPFLAANLDVSAEPALAALADDGRIAPSTVFTDPASGLDIGIIGAITPRLANISSPGRAVVDDDVAAAVNAEAARLEAEGIDRIVLVSHLQGLAEDRALVPELRGIDIVVAGGGDELLKNPGDTCQPDEPAAGPYPVVLSDSDGNDVPVVTGPGGYRCIGQLDVTFDGDGNVVDFSGAAVGVPLDGDAEAYALENVELPLAAALVDLDATTLASSDVELDGRRASVRTGPTNVGELLASALLTAGSADVAVQNGGGIRNDSTIPAGDLTAADTFDIAPFPNFVVTVEVERQRFKELLEVAVAGLPEAEGTFPQIAGFTLELDPDAPARQVAQDGDCALTGDAGSRVRTVTLDDGTSIVADGEVVDGEPLVLATVDFLARGGDCYPLSDLEATTLGLSYQQALARFLVDDLDGEVTGDDWPVAGRRITATGETAPADDTTEDDLPNTGSDSWLWLVVALTAASAGAMVWFEARSASRRSLATRLASTPPLLPEDLRPDSD